MPPTFETHDASYQGIEASLVVLLVLGQVILLKPWGYRDARVFEVFECLVTIGQAGFELHRVEKHWGEVGQEFGVVDVGEDFVKVFLKSGLRQRQSSVEPEKNLIWSSCTCIRSNMPLWTIIGFWEADIELIRRGRVLRIPTS